MKAPVEFLDDNMVVADRIEDCDILSTEASQVRLSWEDQEVNILNTKNVLKLTYAPDPLDPGANAIREEYQLGLLPIFYYKIDF